MNHEDLSNAIYEAKASGKTDQEVMQEFSIGLSEIENAVIGVTGINLNLYSSSRKIRSLFPKEFKLETSSVWSFKSRGNWATHNGDYRGNWSPYIPRNVILRYSHPGDIVLDQFCGGGTTAVEAKLLGRRCIARDINLGAVQLVRRNLDFTVGIQKTLEEEIDDTSFYEPFISVGDACDLSDIEDGSIDLVCTHPPYADIVPYSDGIDGDISLLSVEDFLQKMEDVAAECYRVLKPDGICAILIGDMRNKKRVIPLGFRTIEKFTNLGFSLQDLIIKRQHNCRTTGFWYSSSVKHNFLLLSQEYLPILSKKQKGSIFGISQSIPSHRFRELAKPDPPATMQCKTTWILTDDIESELESNLFNRYTRNESIIEVSFADNDTDEEIKQLGDIDLAYIKTQSLASNLHISKEEIQLQMKNLVSSIGDSIPNNSHLAIRCKDYRIDGSFVCPVLEFWKLPLEDFSIREIVIVTSETENHENKQGDLEINHEYLLIYIKDE